MTNRFFAGQTNYIEEMNALDGETGDHIADATGAHAATAISNTPAGGISATTVQAALNELDTEKFDKAGGAATGPVSATKLSVGDDASYDLNIKNAGSSGASAIGNLLAGNAGMSALFFSDTDANGKGRVQYEHATDTLKLFAGSVARFTQTDSLTTIDNPTSITSTLVVGPGITGYSTPEPFAAVKNSAEPINAVVRNNSSSSSASAGIAVNAYGNSWRMAIGSTAKNSNRLTWEVDALGSPVEKMGLDTSGNLSVVGTVSATSLVDISAAGAGQIKFPATQNASADANTLDDYQEATYTGTATGMTTSPTGTVSYTLTGNEATLNLPEITGTSNATTFTVTGMPAEARPASRKTVLGRAQDNGGAIVPVRIDIETTGVLTIYANADAGAFTASGSKTLAECSVTYTRV